MAHFLIIYLTFGAAQFKHRRSSSGQCSFRMSVRVWMHLSFVQSMFWIKTNKWNVYFQSLTSNKNIPFYAKKLNNSTHYTHYPRYDVWPKRELADCAYPIPYFHLCDWAMQTSSGAAFQQEPAWKYTKKALKYPFAMAVSLVLCCCCIDLISDRTCFIHWHTMSH